MIATFLRWEKIEHFIKRRGFLVQSVELWHWRKISRDFIVVNRNSECNFNLWTGDHQLDTKPGWKSSTVDRGVCRLNILLFLVTKSRKRVGGQHWSLMLRTFWGWHWIKPWFCDFEHSPVLLMMMIWLTKGFFNIMVKNNFNEDLKNQEVVSMHEGFFVCDILPFLCGFSIC